MTRSSFDEVWALVEALTGGISTGTGKSNEILAVDHAGVIRASSTGRRSRIPIRAFRFAVDRLETVGNVTRQEILTATTPMRVSSGVVAVLGSVGRYDLISSPVGLRLRGK